MGNGNMNNPPSVDEKMMAALAHASVFLSFLGGIVPTLIWSFQRRKSDYVRFHALQAMGYQTSFFWLWIIAIIGLVFFSICLLVPITVLIGETSSNLEWAPFLIQPLILVGVFGIFGSHFLIGFVGAIFCFLGREFRYPLLGTWLEKYLRSSADEINETREDDWVAGLCHATAILQMWGMILPIIVSVTQKEGSFRLRFQAIQSAAYQGAAFLAYLLGMMVYMVLFLGIVFALFIGASLNDGREISGPFGAILLVIFLVLMLFGMAVNLLYPFYLLLALFATVSVIRGKDFQYPILGSLVKGRMKPVT
jgi:uncharacterized Tic20 family protein